MGTALVNIQIALLTSGAKCYPSAGSTKFSLLVSKGYSEAPYREKAKKKVMELVLLVSYLRKLNKNSGRNEVLITYLAYFFIVHSETLKMLLPLIVAFLVID